MRVFSLPQGSIGAHGSHGVTMDFLPQITAADDTRVHVARVEAGGEFGRHPAMWNQLFAVVSGTGWVTAGDDEPRQVDAGQAVVWESGDVHQTRAQTDMLVVIVETTGNLMLDDHFHEV